MELTSLIIFGVILIFLIITLFYHHILTNTFVGGILGLLGLIYLIYFLINNQVLNKFEEFVYNKQNFMTKIGITSIVNLALFLVILFHFNPFKFSNKTQTIVTSTAVLMFLCYLLFNFSSTDKYNIVNGFNIQTDGVLWLSIIPIALLFLFFFYINDKAKSTGFILGASLFPLFILLIKWALNRFNTARLGDYSWLPLATAVIGGIITALIQTNRSKITVIATLLGLLSVFFYNIDFFTGIKNIVGIQNIIPPATINGNEMKFIKEFGITLLISLVAVIVLTFIYYSTLTLFTSSSIVYASLLTSLLRYGGIALLICGFIAIVYTLLGKPFFQKQSNSGLLASFLWNFIMYIPCLMIFFVDYLKKEYSLTTKPVWIMLAAESGLIAGWFIIPFIMKLFLTTYTNKNGVQLLKEPVYLNIEKSLGAFNDYYEIKDDGKQNINPKPDLLNNKDYHYAISAWFYLNPQPPNTSSAYNNYTTILDYGKKPAIQFNGKLNSLRVLVDDKEIFETKHILYQRWNNIVVNYDRGTMDVFLNGVLVGSKPNILPSLSNENIKTGSNKGIEGGISNVMFYKDNLTQNYIELYYKTLRDTYTTFV